MDDPRCCQFFLQPHNIWHRRYEALRAYFIEGRPLADIADQFGYRRSALKSMVCRFRAACNNGAPSPFFSRMPADGQPAAPARKIKTDRKSRRSLTVNS